LQPTDPTPLAGNPAGGLAGKYAEGFASHIGLPSGQGSNSPLMTSTYGQPPGWPDASCWPRGPSGLPANGPNSFAGQSDRATCEQAVQGALLQTARPYPGTFAGKFFGGDRQRFLKIANDPCLGSTIAHERQRSLAAAQRSGDDQSTIHHRFPGRLKKALSQVASRRKIDNGPTNRAAGPPPDRLPGRSRRCAARQPRRSRRSRPPRALLRAAAGGT